MNVNMIFSLCSLVYIILIANVYFLRKRVNNVENKIYSLLITCSIIGLSIELSSTFLNSYIVGFESIKLFSLKLINSYFFTWLSIFTFYIYFISTGSDNSNCNSNKLRDIKNFKQIIVLYLIGLLFTIVLPVNVNYNGTYIEYTYGLGVSFVYLVSLLFVIFDVITLVLKRNKVMSKKYIPLFMFIIIGILITVLQIFIPSLLLISSMETFITILMYFTIENPDVKMIEQLQVARDQADKANRAKTDFLSSMSHEIRTPLNAIVGFSDCIMEAQSLGEAKENAHDIVNASQTLLEIVNGILDISKIEAGKIEIINNVYNANEVFLELAKLITPKMKEKGLDFTYSIAPDLPKALCGDHANLRKIVTNLLSNASKYTDRGYVHYEVNCVNTDNVCKLIISVEDSGRGIKKENVDKLFTKFQRLDEDRNTTIEGTGLGLAITKQLVELMGGRIIVHTVYGEGSKFTVVVNQKIEKAEVVEKKKVKTTLDLRDVRILLVDDTELNLKVAKKLLEKYGANQVVTSESGFDCLERIKRGEVYDLILLDDMMPKMSGVVTLQKLKEIAGFNVPTIALTANAITGMREKYIMDGFNDYLAKPIEKEQLINVLNQVLGRSVTEELTIVTNDLESRNFDNEAVRDDIIPVEEIQTIEELDSDDSELVINDLASEELSVKYLKDNGVDLDKALELLGDMEMYNATMSDFIAEVRDKWERIVNYKNIGDMENYAIEVHSLKSDCKYLGFMRLADVAYQHELKSKENDLNFVVENFQRLEIEYKKVLEIVENYLNNINKKM